MNQESERIYRRGVKEIKGLKIDSFCLVGESQVNDTIEFWVGKSPSSDADR